MFLEAADRPRDEPFQAFSKQATMANETSTQGTNNLGTWTRKTTDSPSSVSVSQGFEKKAEPVSPYVQVGASRSGYAAGGGLDVKLSQDTSVLAFIVESLLFQGGSQNTRTVEVKHQVDRQCWLWHQILRCVPSIVKLNHTIEGWGRSCPC